jgi:hypothetical protein
VENLDFIGLAKGMLAFSNSSKYFNSAVSNFDKKYVFADIFREQFIRISKLSEVISKLSLMAINPKYLESM